MPIPKPSDVKSAVVFFSRGLGDHILALPALRALCALFPGKLSLLVSHSAPDLFFGDAGLARIVEVDMDFQREKGYLYDVVAAANRLGEQDLFLSIIPGAAPEWAELSRVLRPRWSVGFAEGFDLRVPTDCKRHAVDEAFAVPRAFDLTLDAEDFSHPFPLPRASVRFVHALRANSGGRRLLVIHGETKPAKQWPPERFRDVLRRFLADRPDYVAIELCEKTPVITDPPPGVLPMISLPLASSIALAAAADLVLCVDSLFLHVADLWRTPTVALFGPTSPEVWGARFNPVCSYVRAQSMAELRVDGVLAELLRTAEQIERLTYSSRPLSPSGNPDLLRWS
jgi:ADP-heptose:LPS heptosyltransferase